MSRNDRFRALRQAELASRLAPENGSVLATVGVAQFRVGQFEAAVMTITKSSELNAKQRGLPYPSELAFMAMAQHQLGQHDAARATLARARDLMQKPPFKGNAFLESYLREAEALIEPTKDNGKKEST